jgi:glycosyltransferase involved in cell wall biosynthesis
VLVSDYRVSVVVAVHNGERFLHECLDSIYGQTFEPFEVIAVDDASTDGSAELIESYPRPVRYLRNETALGPPGTRNTGILAATGDFVAFLDQDDTWEPEKLAKQVAAFEADPQLDYCLCHVRPFWEPEVEDERRRMENEPRGGIVPGYATGPLLARRDAFDRVGLLNPDMWATDAADWFLRAEKAGLRMQLLPDILLNRRFHADNMTRRQATSHRGEWLAMLKNRLDEQRGARKLPGS